MANNIDEKILFQRARNSQGLKIKSNPYKAKNQDDQATSGVLVIDPNKVINKYGQIEDRYVKQEDLTIYASLKVIKKAEMAVISDAGGGVDAQGNPVPPTISASEVSKAIYVNFLNPLKNKKRADGTYERKNKFTTEWTDFFTSDSANDKTSQNYIIDSETFGLHDISIAVNANHLPIIKITFTDVQGRMLFERGNDPDSPYNIFFTYPYPKFYLTYKGYFGKSVEMPMYLLKSNTRFIPESGDYEVTAEFQSEMFGLFNTFLIIYAYAAPYMFMSDGDYLGRQILNKLYDDQNKKIEEHLNKVGKPESFKEYKIERCPTLYDLSRAVKIIPSSAFNVGDSDTGKKDEQVIRIKSAIESYHKSVISFFDNPTNYSVDRRVIATSTSNNNVIENLIYKPTKPEFRFTSNRNPVEFYNAIDSLNKLIIELQEIDTYMSGKQPNSYIPAFAQLKKFIKEDVFITNNEYKNQVESPNGLIIKDTMFFNTGETILDASDPTKVEYVIHNFDRVVIELLNQASYIQTAIENLYIDEEVTELGTHLGYEPNLNNVLRIISNNMQTFLTLMEIMGKNGLKQIQNDPKRRKIHESKTGHISDRGGKTKQFTSFPNYYKTVKRTLTAENKIIDQKVLAYPGIDASNQDWFEVLFVEEIYKALQTIKDIANPQNINTIQKKFTSILTVFGLGDLDLDVYLNKKTATTLLSEAISKYLLYTTYSGIPYRGIDTTTMEQIGLSIAQFEIDTMNKTIFSPSATDDVSRIRLDVFDFIKNKDTLVDPSATGIKNAKSNNAYVKYTHLGNLGINGVNAQFNGSKDSPATIQPGDGDGYGTVSIYSKLKEFVNSESELYGKKYTKAELESVISKRNDYVQKSIQNNQLYQNIAFTKTPNPLKYSIMNPDGKTDNFSVYPDIRSSTAYYSDVAKSGNFDVVNTSLSSVSESNYDINPFQGLYKNLNEKLKTNVLLNSDVTRNVAVAKATVPALTHNTKNDELSIDGFNTPFGKVTKPSSSYHKLYTEL